MHWHADPNRDIGEADTCNAALRFMAGNRLAAIQAVENIRESVVALVAL
jgi:hypothetical protein